MSEFVEDQSQGTIERIEDIGTTPAAQVKRWLLELKIADKEERTWRKEGQRILDKYRGESKNRNKFNILWSNTETLLPALYNSRPSPDVRRRFRDKDPIGRAASTITTRCLEYAIDTTSFDDVIRAAVLDMLLPGRAVTRVRYVPSFAQVGTPEGHAEEMEETTHEAQEGTQEELAWEQVDVEQVQWDDFRRGPGKSWDEVPWVAFRHRMTRDDLAKLNPEVGEEVELDSADDDDVRKADQAVADLFKTAEVWEIWCKEDRKVYFIAESYKASPVKVEDDPLNLLGFFPNPRPMQAIADASSLIPVPLFTLYEDQAIELEAITGRIGRLVKGLKLRGVYDATISELSQIMRGEDNDLIPAQNVSALLDRGGLEKAIWFMPIEMAARVLKELIVHREQIKQTIYEITGISDILRGATNASETATAQQIKNKWGTLRIQRLQQEVQRYIRDLFRIMAEIIGERFTPQTLAAQSLQPPELVMQILPVLRSDMMREFHIDVETDSTVAASLESDMSGLREVLQGVVEFTQGIGPAVQAGAVPIEAAKEIIMAIIRRARLGNAVEDAWESLQAPQTPQGIPLEQIEQAKQQYEQQIQQLQQAMQKMGQQLQQSQQAQQQAEQALQAAQQNAQVKVYEVDKKAEVEAIRAAQETERAQLEATTKVLLAQMQQAAKPEEGEVEAEEPAENAIATALQSFQMAIEQLSRPKQVIRDENGSIIGVQTV